MWKMQGHKILKGEINNDNVHKGSGKWAQKDQGWGQGGMNVDTILTFYD